MSNGYHSISGDHNIYQYDKKTRRKYIIKNKTPILNAFTDIVNDFYMQKHISYGYYAKCWNWHKRDIKIFINHLGFDIPTGKNQYQNKKIQIIEAIKSNKHPENIYNIAKKYFGTPNGTALEHQMEQQKQTKTITYKNYGLPNGTALEHQMDGIIINYNNKRNNKRNINKHIKSDSKKNPTTNVYENDFEEWWKLYKQITKKIIKQYGKEYVSGNSLKKPTYKLFKECCKSLTVREIKAITLAYSAEVAGNIKLKMQLYFLKHKILDDPEGSKENYLENGLKYLEKYERRNNANTKTRVRNKIT